MKTAEQQIDDMISLLRDGLGDARKHGNGNNAAGGRVRKTLQNVASLCKELRKQVQEERLSVRD